MLLFISYHIILYIVSIQQKFAQMNLQKKSGNVNA